MAFTAACWIPPQQGTSMRTIGHALNIVLADDLCKLLAVVYRIQFWTSDQGNLSLNEILVEICIGVGSTICCNEKVCSVKVSAFTGTSLICTGHC